MRIHGAKLAFAAILLAFPYTSIEAMAQIPSGTALPEAPARNLNVRTGSQLESPSVRDFDTGDVTGGLPDASSQEKTQTPAAGQSNPQNLPDAPSSSQQGPSLGDLGFPTEASQGNPKEQALLDKRTHMLKIHQKLGLITTIPLVAAIISSAGAGGKQTSTSSRYLHLGLGAAAGDMYFTTAYFAIFAPKIAGTQTKGPIRVHKALAWIHGPGMILTPILGAIAFNQKSHGEKIHGIAQAHLPVALVTAGAYGAALLSVSVKF